MDTLIGQDAEMQHKSVYAHSHIYRHKSHLTTQKQTVYGGPHACNIYEQLHCVS